MKIVMRILIFIMVILFPTVVFAANANISISSQNAYVGDSVTVTVNCFAGTWNLAVSGAVNDTIVGFNMDSNASCSKSYTLTANSPSTLTVKLSGDITDYDTDVTTYPSGSVSVTFDNRPAPTPAPTPTPVTPTTPSRPVINKETEKKIEEKKSNNTNLKELNVEGYNLETVDNINYRLVVNNQVGKIKINAVVEDSKASVTGIGEHELALGENSFKIVVIAEDGTKKEYSLVVNRKKDKYYLSDLKDALNNEDSVEIMLKDDDIISSDALTLIKEKGKDVRFVKYDNKNKEVYSFIISSKDLDNVKDLNTKIIKETNKDKYKNKFDYDEGISIQFGHKEEFPNGTKVKIYVGDKYKNGTRLELYYYNDNDSSNSKIKDNIEVVNGYIVFEIDKGTDYFVKTRDKELTIACQEKKKKLNPFLIISIIEAIIIIAGIIFFIRYKKKMETKIKSYDTIQSNNNVVENKTNGEEQVELPKEV